MALSLLEQAKTKESYNEGLIELFAKIIPELPRFLPNSAPHCFSRQNEYRLYAMDIGITPELRIPSQQIKEIDSIQRVLSEPFLAENVVEILVGSKNDFKNTKDDIIKELRGYFSEEQLHNIIKKSDK